MNEKRITNKNPGNLTSNYGSAWFLSGLGNLGGVHGAVTQPSQDYRPPNVKGSPVGGAYNTYRGPKSGGKSRGKKP